MDQITAIWIILISITIMGKWLATNLYTSEARRLEEPVLINALGIHDKIEPRIVRRARGTADYLLMQFHDPIEVFVAGRMQEFLPKSFVIWQPGAPHLYGNSELPWCHSWMHFEGHGVADLVASTGIPLDKPIQLWNTSLMDRYLGAVYDEVRTHTLPDATILYSLLKIWMIELHRELSNDQINGVFTRRLIEVRRYIEKNYSDPITLGDLADVAGLSKGYLCAEFKCAFGASPIDYVVNYRLKTAAYLLSDLNLSVSEIAERVGFTDPMYFSRQFKQRYGVSPLNFRDSL